MKKVIFIAVTVLFAVTCIDLERGALLTADSGGNGAVIGGWKKKNDFSDLRLNAKPQRKSGDPIISGDRKKRDFRAADYKVSDKKLEEVHFPKQTTIVDAPINVSIQKGDYLLCSGGTGSGSTVSGSTIDPAKKKLDFVSCRGVRDLALLPNPKTFFNHG